MGVSPSIRKELRVPELMMTLSPMMMRSNGFNSTLSGIVAGLSGEGLPNGIEGIFLAVRSLVQEVEGGGAYPAAWILVVGAWLSAAAAARSTATGSPAPAPRPRSTDGSKAPGCRRPA